MPGPLTLMVVPFRRMSPVVLAYTPAPLPVTSMVQPLLMSRLPSVVVPSALDSAMPLPPVWLDTST
ncbi:hypothetical protein D3C86_2214160 [compost metagenome]